MVNQGTVLYEQYEVVKLIGKGGMSAVYLANDTKNSRQCAIKIVEKVASDNSVTVQSLAAEARMLKSLSSPYLPQIFDIHETQDTFVMVMEYIQGISLDKVLVNHGPQRVSDVILWGIQLCEVFAYLHSQNPPIIYRDMKPANVMLLASGDIQVIDFGTARTQKLGVEMNSDTVMIGTEGFAAPEQYGGLGQSDARTDIYCLGATMYNLLTGKMPHQGMLLSIANTDWLKGTPLGDILTKCLQTDPSRRYQNAQELIQDLRYAQAGGNKANTGWLKSNKTAVSGGGWQMGNALSGILKGRSSGALKTGRMGTGRLTPQAQRQEGSAEARKAAPAFQQVPDVAQTPAYQPPAERAPAAPAPVTAPAPPPKPEPPAQDYPAQPQENSRLGMWKALLILAGVAMAIFAAIGIVSALNHAESAAILSMGVAIAAALFAAVCAAGVAKNR